MENCQNYNKIIVNGVFYYPAWKHYGKPANVICDRCLKQELKACIGYVDQDLCLECVNSLIPK